MKKAVMLALALMLCKQVIPQIGPRLDFTPNIPQAIYQNPANTPWCTTFLALPGLSGVNATMSNNVSSLEGLGLSFTDLQNEGFINESVYNQLALRGQDINQVRAGSTVDILGFGFRKGAHFFAISIREQIYTQMNLPKSLLRFPEDQSQGFVGAPENYDLSAFDFSAIHYRPYTLHYAWTAQPGLTVGIQASYIAGKYSVKSFNQNLQFMQPFGNTLGFDVDGNIAFLSSGFRPADSTNTTMRDILLKPQNHGFSAGFGMKYVFPSQTELMISATNVGFIQWKKNNGYTYFDKDLVDKEQSFDEIWDQVFDIEQKSDTSYQQAIPPYFSIAINQYVARQTAIGVFYQGSPYLGRFQSTAGITASTRVKNWMSANLGYVYTDGNHSVSAGLSFNAGPVQLYMVTDNLLGLVDLSNTQYFNSQIGINLVFGNRVRPELADWDNRPKKTRTPDPVFPDPNNENTDMESVDGVTVITVEGEEEVAPQSDTFSADDPFHFATDGGPEEFVASGTILLFQGPNLSTMMIGKINPSEQIRVLEKRPNDWWLIQTPALTGWLKPQDLLIPVTKETESEIAEIEDSIEKEKMRTPERDSFFVITDIPLYEQPYTDAAVIMTLHPNDLVVLYDKENYKWWYVAKGSRGGWVESLYLAPFDSFTEIPAELEGQIKSEEIVETETKSQIERELPLAPLPSLGTYTLVESTSMRSGPNQGSGNITRLRTGYKVELLEQTNKYWWKIRYKGQIGYAKASKLAVE